MYRSLVDNYKQILLLSSRNQMAFINRTHLLANANYDGCTYSLEMSSMEVIEYAGECGFVGSVYQGLRTDLRFQWPVGPAVSPTEVFISLGRDRKVISIDQQSGYAAPLFNT